MYNPHKYCLQTCALVKLNKLVTARCIVHYLSKFSAVVWLICTVYINVKIVKIKVEIKANKGEKLCQSTL